MSGDPKPGAALTEREDERRSETRGQLRLSATASHLEKSNCCRVSPYYIAQQFDIHQKMRAILINWLIEVHHKFNLRDETSYLTVNIIDRFLAQQAVVRKKLQLVDLVAMLLACKYEEVFVPVVEDVVFILDKAYSRKEVLQMGRLMLNTPQFNMSVPTPCVFMRRYLKAAQSDRKLEDMTPGILFWSGPYFSLITQTIGQNKLNSRYSIKLQADFLRQQTFQQMRWILTTRLAARALLVISDYMSRLGALSSLWLARPKD